MELLSDSMPRREALKRVALLLGGAVSAPTLAGVLAGCERAKPAGGAWRPEALSAEQNELVTALAETILPATDTPGAKSAGVNEFIDRMLAHYYPPEARQSYLAGLARVDERAREAYGKRFAECTAQQQNELAGVLDRATYRKPELPQGEPLSAEQRPPTQEGEVATGRGTGPGAVAASGAVAVDAQPNPEELGSATFWRTMKELTLVGYYTSEVGATRELRVNPMGAWRADIPYSQVGSSWA